MLIYTIVNYVILDFTCAMRRSVNNNYILKWQKNIFNNNWQHAKSVEMRMCESSYMFVVNCRLKLTKVVSLCAIRGSGITCMHDGILKLSVT